MSFKSEPSPLQNGHNTTADGSQNKTHSHQYTVIHSTFQFEALDTIRMLNATRKTERKMVIKV